MGRFVLVFSLDFFFFLQLLLPFLIPLLTLRGFIYEFVCSLTAVQLQRTSPHPSCSSFSLCSSSSIMPVQDHRVRHTSTSFAPSLASLSSLSTSSVVALSPPLAKCINNASSGSNCCCAAAVSCNCCLAHEGGAVVCGGGKGA